MQSVDSCYIVVQALTCGVGDAMCGGNDATCVYYLI